MEREKKAFETILSEKLIGNIIRKIVERLEPYFMELEPLQKQDAILFLKYTYIPQLRAKNKADESFFNGSLKMVTESTNQKIVFIEDWIKEKEQAISNHESQIRTKPNITLSDLITHKYSREIVEGLKIQYKNIKGKRLKLLLLALQNLDLLPKERIAKKFHDCCKVEFGWNIASYNAMNEYNFNEITDSEEFNGMKKDIKTLTEQKKPLA